MTTQHTPGPWQVKKWKRESVADGFETAITDWRGHGIVVFCQKEESKKVEANATLISRAPCLKRILNQFHTCAMLDGDIDWSAPDDKALEITVSMGMLKRMAKAVQGLYIY